MKITLSTIVRLVLALIAAVMAFWFVPKPLPELSRAEFMDEVHAIREAAIQQLHDRPTDSIQQLAGRILQCEPGWCRMSVDGERGWVQSSALWGVSPGEVIE